MNIFVGCSSRDTDNKSYNMVAEQIASYIINGGHNLVFGGCEHGLMGKIYSLVSKSNKSDIIVTSAKAYEGDLKNISYSKSYVSNTVNERKNTFTSISDIMIFIPGGIGTVDEIMTAIETRRNHEHNIPIIIINVDNFFGHLLDMLDKIYHEGFADPKNRQLYIVTDTASEANNYLLNL